MQRTLCGKWLELLKDQKEVLKWLRENYKELKAKHEGKYASYLREGW